MTAGYLYQAVLHHELTNTLEVQWTPVRRGVGEFAGVPNDVCRLFSERRQEIDALLAGTGRAPTRGPPGGDVGNAPRQGSRRHRRWRGDAAGAVGGRGPNALAVPAPQHPPTTRPPARPYQMKPAEWSRASAHMVDRVDALTRFNRRRGLAQMMATHTMNDLRLPTS